MVEMVSGCRVRLIRIGLKAAVNPKSSQADFVKEIFTTPKSPGITAQDHIILGEVSGMQV
jgi:hypothetical protein